MSDISILFEEPSFLAVNKPTGLLSQSTYGVDSLIFRLRAWMQSRDNLEHQPFAELPHRLDRGTSGVLLVAKTKAALTRLGDQFHSRKTAKRYLVAVEGFPKESRGTWVDWLKKIPDVAKSEIATPDDPTAREAILHYRELYRDGRHSIQEVVLETGRMHQIRLQFASRGMPVIGDQTYGSTVLWADTLRDEHDEHFGLHAHWLSFRHPKDGRGIQITAPFPSLWYEHFPGFVYSRPVD